MTAAIVSLAVLAAALTVGLVAIAFAYRRAQDDRTIAYEDRILAVAARDAAVERAALAESERDGALTLAQALQDDAARARQGEADAIANAARVATDVGLAALADGLLTRRQVPDAAAAASGDGDAAPGAVRPAATAKRRTARAGAGK